MLKLEREMKKEGWIKFSLMLSITLVAAFMAEALAFEADKERNRNGERRSRVERQERRERRGQRVERRQRRERREERVARRERRERRAERIERRERRERRQQRRIERRRRQTSERPIVRRSRRNIDRPVRVTPRNRNFTRYYHRPYRNIDRHERRYHRPLRYHRSISRDHLLMRRWVRLFVNLVDDGYYYYNGYPYYVYNGYRHRYSDLDYCDYELVDREDYSVRDTYFAFTCSTGYDLCADRRDDLNDLYGYRRFFCSERLDEDYIW